MSWLGVICRCSRKRALRHMVDTLRAELCAIAQRLHCVLHTAVRLYAFADTVENCQLELLDRVALQLLQSTHAQHQTTNAEELKMIHSSGLE
jgi:hypothetical protein